MCISPSFVWVQRGPKWEKQQVACRQCWRCRQNRVNDYVARALAEASTSQHVATISLTYAPRDDLADRVLDPTHFQLFMKLLRRSGHKVRYLVAGEYGDLKGRAHFHAILFFKHLEPQDGPAPSYNAGHVLDPSSSSRFSRQIPQKRMVHIREWPHGHVSVDWSADERSARYVCKYLLAENKNNAWFSLSKKPTLGAEFFAKKAARACELGVLPHSFEYLPPGGNRDRPYLMTGATRRDYLDAITQDERDRPRMSEWVAATFDKRQKARLQEYYDALPVEVVDEAVDEMRRAEEQQSEAVKAATYRRLTAHLEALIEQSAAGYLRRKDGRWVPAEEVPNV